MAAKVMFGILLLHLFTFLGVFAVAGETGECAGSGNYLCGTPLAGLFEGAAKLGISANPFKVAGSILAVVGLMADLTWYDYAALNESTTELVLLYVWVVKAGFLCLRLYLLYRVGSVIANAVGRFFGR